MNEREWIRFELNGFMLNAGILGLIRVLEHLEATKGEDYKVEEDVLLVKATFFQEMDFAESVLDVLNKIYYKSPSSPVYQFDRRFKLIEFELKEKEENEEYEFSNNFKENLSWLKKSNFFNSRTSTLAKSYAILDSITGSDLTGLLTKVEGITKSKVKNTDNQMIEVYRELNKELSNPYVRRHLIAAWVGFRGLSEFYKNTLHVKENNGTISVTSNLDLVEQIGIGLMDDFIDYINEDQKYKKNWICGCCGEEKVREKSFKLSNMRHVLKDANRKSSVFWDFDEKKSKLCDKCAFLYKLMPLGFSYVQKLNQAIFINANHSIEILIAMNREIAIDDEGMSYSVVYNRLKSQKVKKYLSLLSNIQLVIKDFESENNGYRFNTIGADILDEVSFYEEKKRRDKFSAFHALSEVGMVQISKTEYINAYETVVDNIFNRKNHYALFYMLMRSGLTMDGTKQRKVAQYISDIQFNKNHIKGVENVKKTSYYLEMKRQARATGKRMDDVLTKMSRRSDSYSIRLLNALSVNNQEAFITLVQRLHVIYKVEIPAIVINGLTNPKTFRDVGNEYLLGISNIVKEYEPEKTKEGLNDEQ